MNGQGNSFNEQNILQTALNDTKLMAASINGYILEAADDNLRRDYMTALGDVYNQQKQIFDIMSQKGYYAVSKAQPQEIMQAKEEYIKNRKES